MDPIQPVGAMIQPPNPNQGLNAYSTLLGIQQQRQGLQLGQQQLAVGEANVQQKQQQNSELQNLSSFTKKAIGDPNYQLQDGSPDVQKFQRDAMQAAPTYGQQYIGQITSNFKEAVETRRALQNLSGEQNKQISDGLKGIATNPRATSTDLLDAVSQLRSNNKDPAFNRALDNFLLGAARHSPQEAAANGASVLGGLAVTAPSQVDKGGSVVPGVTTQLGPGVGTFSPAGPAVGKTLAPQMVTPPGGVPTQVGGAAGAGPQSGSAKNLSGFPGPQPTDQDMTRFGKYSDNLDARVAAAADTVPRINLIEQAINAGQGGGGSTVRAGIAQKLQAMGAPKELVDSVAGGNLASMQEAEKMLFQTTLAGLKQSMQGDATHVAQFQEAVHVFPNVDTDPRARQKILGFIRDQSNRDFAEQQALTEARQKGTFNPVTWQGEWQQRLRSGQAPGVPGSQVPKSITRTGMHNGRKVAQYSDGSIQYTD